jgi:hypothetical protein
MGYIQILTNIARSNYFNKLKKKEKLSQTLRLSFFFVRNSLSKQQKKELCLQKS